MMFLACMFSYVIRTNLSITIVAMVNATSKDGGFGPACNAMDIKSNKTDVIQDVS
jgi:ACS family sodium-dependent inorganic phosphate cotransporter